MSGRLAGKVALVTGAGDGIGKAIALAYAREGARVAVLDVNRDAADRVREEIESLGGEALAIAADVRDVAQVEGAIALIESQWKALDILVNNAGIARKKMFEQMEPGDWEEVWGTNLTGAINVTRKALPLLKQNPGSRIVNVASIEVFSHSRKLSSYAASKGALASLSRTLAVELAPHKVNVNYICPGFIDTAMTKPYSKRWLFRKYVERQTPLRRMGTAEDVAGVALFLASSDADFVTGQGITVDGGLTARSL
jgi:NAD(P)-dependent dehydrogenase (short-subunit alcohol dehydrogenase family)